MAYIQGVGCLQTALFCLEDFIAPDATVRIIDAFCELVDYISLWKGISIYRTGAQHGSSEVLKLLGTACGFVLKAEIQPIDYLYCW
jgi:hypothetical protein